MRSNKNTIRPANTRLVCKLFKITIFSFMKESGVLYFKLTDAHTNFHHLPANLMGIQQSIGIMLMAML